MDEGTREGQLHQSWPNHSQILLSSCMVLNQSYWHSSTYYSLKKLFKNVID